MSVRLTPLMYTIAIGLSVVGTTPIRADSYSDCLSACMGRRGCAGIGSRDAFSCSADSGECTRECLLANSHGAIAYSSSTGNAGVSENWSSEEEAREEAMKYCGRYADDCVVEVTFQNACGAIAVGANGRRGWGRAYIERDAAVRAIQGCNERGGRDCKVEISHCSKY